MLVSVGPGDDFRHNLSVGEYLTRRYLQTDRALTYAVHDEQQWRARRAALLHMHVGAQGLVVEVALEDRFDSGLQAVRLDPLSRRLRSDEACTMLRELVSHNVHFAPSAV